MQFPETQMTMLISCNIENNKYKPQRIFIIAEFPTHIMRYTKESDVAPKEKTTITG